MSVDKEMIEEILEKVGIKYGMDVHGISYIVNAHKLAPYLQPKLPKDSVVMSREDYIKKICEECESTVKDCKFHYEEIAIPHIVQVIKNNPNISDEEIEELVRQTGVEIKE